MERTKATLQWTILQKVSSGTVSVKEQRELALNIEMSGANVLKISVFIFGYRTECKHLNF